MHSASNVPSRMLRCAIVFAVTLAACAEADTDASVAAQHVAAAVSQSDGALAIRHLESWLDAATDATRTDRSAPACATALARSQLMIGPFSPIAVFATIGNALTLARRQAVPLAPISARLRHTVAACSPCHRSRPDSWHCRASDFECLRLAARLCQSVALALRGADGGLDVARQVVRISELAMAARLGAPRGDEATSTLDDHPRLARNQPDGARRGIVVYAWAAPD